jgi:hypothetical protein
MKRPEAAPAVGGTDFKSVPPDTFREWADFLFPGERLSADPFFCNTPDDFMLRKGGMNDPATSCWVSKAARNESSFGEYDPERFRSIYFHGTNDARE